MSGHVEPRASVPAVVVAAPSSGSGKTTVATGLMGALRAAGQVVAPFKVGPDFIDPGYHGLAAGRPGRNLDPVLAGEELVGPLFGHGTRGADIAVVEGVMGLYDGRLPARGSGPAAPIPMPAPGSTAQVAALLGAPVALVVDARGQSQSIAALVHGYATFDPRTRLAGVILNRVGSARHEDVLRRACAQTGVPVWGALPREEALGVPSRHLGLVTAREHGDDAEAAVAAMTDLVARHVDLDAVRAAARSAVDVPAWDPAAAVGAPAHGVTVAVAAGRAFTFGYAEHHELLTAAGARVVEFDPLVEPLPDGAAALVLPGGFPEQYAPALAANTELHAQVRALAEQGGVVHAECGGLLYLLDDLDGTPLAGVLAGSGRFTDRLTLGYRDAVAVAASPLHPLGARVVGHEFHRTRVTLERSYDPAWAFTGPGGTTVHDGAIVRGVHASYLHTHPAAQPGAVAGLVAHAAGSRL